MDGGSASRTPGRPSPGSPGRTRQRPRETRTPLVPVTNTRESPGIKRGTPATPTWGDEPLSSSVKGSELLAGPHDPPLLASFNVRHFTKAKLSGTSRSKGKPKKTSSRPPSDQAASSYVAIKLENDHEGSGVSVADTLVNILTRFSITCIQEGRDTGRTTYIPHPEPVVERSYCPLTPPRSGASAGSAAGSESAYRLDPARFVPTCALSESLLRKLPAGTFAAAASEGLGGGSNPDGPEGKNRRGKASYKERYLLVWRKDIWKLVGAWEETQPLPPPSRMPRGAYYETINDTSGSEHAKTRLERNPFVGHFVHRLTGVHVVTITIHIKPTAAVAELEVLSGMIDDLRSRIDEAAKLGRLPALEDLKRPLPPLPAQPSVGHSTPRPPTMTRPDTCVKPRWRPFLRNIFRGVSSWCCQCIYGGAETSHCAADEEAQVDVLGVGLEAMSLNGGGRSRSLQTTRQADRAPHQKRPVVLGPVLLGDLNAGRTYLPKSARKRIPLFSDAAKYHFCISDDVDTTVTAGTNEAYDRIVVPADQASFFGQGFAVRFDDLVVNTGKAHVSQKDVLKISDHYPVAVALHI